MGISFAFKGNFSSRVVLMRVLWLHLRSHGIYVCIYYISRAERYYR